MSSFEWSAQWECRCKRIGIAEFKEWGAEDLMEDCFMNDCTYTQHGEEGSEDLFCLRVGDRPQELYSASALKRMLN
jgi:hypothetical protein